MRVHGHRHRVLEARQALHLLDFRTAALAPGEVMFDQLALELGELVGRLDPALEHGHRQVARVVGKLRQPAPDALQQGRAVRALL